MQGGPALRYLPAVSLDELRRVLGAVQLVGNCILQTSVPGSHRLHADPVINYSLYQFKKKTFKAVKHIQIQIRPDPHKCGPLDPDLLFSCGSGSRYLFKIA